MEASRGRQMEDGGIEQTMRHKSMERVADEKSEIYSISYPF